MTTRSKITMAMLIAAVVIGATAADARRRPPSITEGSLASARPAHDCALSDCNPRPFDYCRDPDLGPQCPPRLRRR